MASLHVMTLTTTSSPVPPVRSPYDTSTGYSSPTHGFSARFTEGATPGSSSTSLTASTSSGVAYAEAIGVVGFSLPATASAPAGPSSRAPVPPVAHAETNSARAASTAVAVITA